MALALPVILVMLILNYQCEMKNLLLLLLTHFLFMTIWTRTSPKGCDSICVVQIMPVYGACDTLGYGAITVEVNSWGHP